MYAATKTLQASRMIEEKQNRNKVSMEAGGWSVERGAWSVERGAWSVF
jgi:hypothetical protein